VAPEAPPACGAGVGLLARNAATEAELTVSTSALPCTRRPGPEPCGCQPKRRRPCRGPPRGARCSPGCWSSCGRQRLGPALLRPGYRLPGDLPCSPGHWQIARLTAGRSLPGRPCQPPSLAQPHDSCSPRVRQLRYLAVLMRPTPTQGESLELAPESSRSPTRDPGPGSLHPKAPRGYRLLCHQHWSRWPLSPQGHRKRHPR